MILKRDGREFYELKIATSASTGEPVAPDAWEASFDGGTSWVDATVITHDAVDWSSWLLAGPDAEDLAEGEEGEAVATISATLRPLLRVVDGTEIIVRTGPQVVLC